MAPVPHSPAGRPAPRAALALVFAALVTVGLNLGASDFEPGRRLLMQRTSLLVALGATPLLLWLGCRGFRRPPVLFALAASWVPVLLLRPNTRKFMPDGIADSSPSDALAILGLVALAVIVRHLRMESRVGALLLVLSSLFLSVCALLHGELLLVFAFMLLWLAVLRLRDRSSRPGIVLVLVALPLFPIVNGLLNGAVFGQFLPPRIQAGNNQIHEPIGQQPSPYGVRHDDVRREKPAPLLDDFKGRLDRLSEQLGVLLNVWTVFPVLLAAGFLVWWDPRWLYVSLPLVMAIGHLLLHRLPSGVAPAHFLINLFLCLAAAFGVSTLLERRAASQSPVATSPPC